MPGNSYTAFSRFTDPGAWAHLLTDLSATVPELCVIAERQTIHHNLLGYFGITPAVVKTMRRVWPPRMPDILESLAATEPRRLDEVRLPANRVVGACMLESHFLAGLLRSKGFPTRIRAGYFQGIRSDAEHTVAFWHGALRARGVEDELFETDPDRWYRDLDALSRSLNAADHHIEHWICEYHDAPTGAWRLLDANRSFLKAHSDIDVGIHLPSAHFEYAYEAWQTMRSDSGYDPHQHAEEPQDGRSHIRSQLLGDYYSLLNHDLAGIEELQGETSAFVKDRAYEDVSPAELTALDDLAMLISTAPSVDRLAEFYFAQGSLRIPAAEEDPYSFVFAG